MSMTQEERDHIAVRLLEVQEQSNEDNRRVHAEHAARTAAEFAHAQAFRDQCAAEMSTLRDDFAKAALTGMLARHDARGNAAEYANLSYEFADAMLNRRRR
jgi:hypothetical protein